MSTDSDAGGAELVVDFHVHDRGGSSLVRQSFADDEICETVAFTGAQIITVILLASKEGIGRLLDFLSHHREQYKDAKIRIGTEELSIQGYSIEEIQRLFDSGHLAKLIREVKKR